MKDRNAFCPKALSEELTELRRALKIVETAANGQGAYPLPVPDLEVLQRYERELVARIKLCTFVSQLSN